jgi:hypothetical protein
VRYKNFSAAQKHTLCHVDMWWREKKAKFPKHPIFTFAQRLYLSISFADELTKKFKIKKLM